VKFFFEGFKSQAEDLKSDAENVVHLMNPDTIELVDAHYKLDKPYMRCRILSTIRAVSFSD
jgi:hypothetical protein